MTTPIGEVAAQAAAEVDKQRVTGSGVWDLHSGVWDLRFGRVTAVPATADAVVNIQLDGDIQQSISAISLIGVNLAVGARVAVVSIPPSGNYVVAAPSPRSVAAFLQLVFTTISTVYTLGTAPQTFGVAFVAPPSGRVKVHWSAEIHHGTSFLLVSPQVATGTTVGSGTAVTGWSANDDRTVRNDGASDIRSADMDIVDSLTPGGSYNVALYHRVGGGTGSIGRRRIVVAPVL